MGERYLIDTSAAIKYLNEIFSVDALQWLDNILDTECNLSVITQIELMVWQTEDETEMDTLKSFVESAKATHVSIPRSKPRLRDAPVGDPVRAYALRDQWNSFDTRE